MKKRYQILSVFFVFAVSAALSSCGGRVYDLSIAHVNDLHSHVLQFPRGEGVYGGYARLDDFLAARRAGDPKHFLLLCAGDMLTGSAFSTFYHGDFDIALLNQMGFSATAIGNHEFDYGVSNLLHLRSEANFPFLSANVTLLSTGKDPFEPYMTTNIGGLKIAIIGLTTSDIGEFTTGISKEIAIENEVVCLTNLLAATSLDKTNDLMILLSHCGFDVDEAIARNVPQLDLIVGGHTHTAVFSPRKIGDTYIVQAGSYSQYVGTIDLKVRDGRIVKFDYKLVAVTTNLPENAAMKLEISNTNLAINALMSNVICRSDVFLDNAEVRNSPQPIGNLMADMIESFTTADVALVNAGSIRSFIPKGNVTIRDIYELSPFDNQLVVCNLKGSYLLGVIERGITNRTFGAFMYYSRGMEVRVKRDGSFTASLNGKPIDPDKTYRIAVNDFMAAGGDNYSELTNATGAVNTGWLVRDLIMKYLTGLKTLNSDRIDAKPRVIFEYEI